ncbi:unnamed protein product [Rotaria sp. Silwood2]|nr:unnamed protein product [Rotaria sp. Silwood2]CAF2996567.1 unnamed protein product [Rotaria sp. Silwood2]CAF3306153.1 unnamed protein product [Rotaria sp. Silwood2]CAF3360338.1 unnamed protein product [Rotaria sp. Silwood2]CAF4092959.1 unnamed protein product [Rotaria sp. Silwood2]
MTNDDMESLAHVVLTENVFIYNDKCYQQINNDTMESPFTLALANIFMWLWKQELIKHQKVSNELCIR